MAKILPVCVAIWTTCYRDSRNWRAVITLRCLMRMSLPLAAFHSKKRPRSRVTAHCLDCSLRADHDLPQTQPALHGHFLSLGRPLVSPGLRMPELPGNSGQSTGESGAARRDPAGLFGTDLS
jgi:hypothetical protein